MPMGKDTPVYHYPGHLPSKSSIAKLLGIQIDEVRLVCPAQTEGISRQDVEKHLAKSAKRGAWDLFIRIFALVIYGTILFPSISGVIDLKAISVFLAVEHYKVNPVAAILAETYMALTWCHTKRGGSLKCCLPLLDIWLLSHVCGKENLFRQRHDSYSNPLSTFKIPRKYAELDRDGWMSVFSQLKEESLLWKIEWWFGEEVLYCCGDFLNIPLMGSRGCINYNPSLALRQLAFMQKVPSEAEVQPIYFMYDQKEMGPLYHNVKEAWRKITYRGRAEFGKRMINASPEYITWLTERIGGAKPVYAVPSPFQSGDVQDVNHHLVKELEAKEIELKELMKKDARNEEKLRALRNECAVLQGKVQEARKRKGCEESFEIKRLRKENLKLKGTVKEIQKQASDQESRLKHNQMKLIRTVKEKEALEQRMQGLRPLEELQNEINGLTEQLQRKINELALVRGNAARRAQELSRELSQKTDALEGWKSLYFKQTNETKEWMKRFKKMVALANTAIPDLAWALPRAKNMISPLHTPDEINEFFNLCGEIIEELGVIARV